MADKPSYLGLLNAVANAESQAHAYLTAWADVTPDAEVLGCLAEVRRCCAIVGAGTSARILPAMPVLVTSASGVPGSRAGRHFACKNFGVMCVPAHIRHREIRVLIQ